MNLHQRTIRLGLFFIAVLAISGALLMYKGNDAVAMGLVKKEGMLTTEQVKLAFDSVSGRMLEECVKEGQEVKKGDIVMVLDSTDVDLSIEKTKAQIAQLNAQIQSQQGAIRIGYSQTDTSEEESRRAIDQQRAAVASAEATRHNEALNYQRMSALAEQGAISRSELDNAYMALQVAEANVLQQKQGLFRLLGGAVDTGVTDSMTLPSIEEARQTIMNKENDVEALMQQKRQLEITLQELYVQKERLTLRAPEDGKILTILAKKGEMVSPSTPVILLESKRYYYDIYLSEKQIGSLYEGKSLTGHTVADNREVAGTIRLITQAPGFADLKMTREKGQADLSAFQIRIYTAPNQNILPGMTIEVDDDEFLAR